jgi:hypothetical protein
VTYLSDWIDMVSGELTLPFGVLPDETPNGKSPRASAVILQSRACYGLL